MNMGTGFDKLALALLMLSVASPAALGQSSRSVGQVAPAAQAQANTPPAGNGVAVRPRQGGALYIAGDGFSLEQAIDDGVRENPGGSPFAVLVLGAEISKLGFHGATTEVSSVILKAIKAGGALYLCERDVKRLSLAAHDFLPGVQIVRGYSKAEAQAAGIQPKPGAPPLAPLFRMRAICAD